MKKIITVFFLIFMLSLCLSACGGDTASAGEDITGVVFNDASFVYDGEEKSIEISGTLPEGVSCTYTNNKATNAGIYNVTAALSGEGFKPLTLTATLTIEKASYDLSGISWDYTEPFTYDGTAKTVSVTNLPEGLTVKYYTNDTAGTNVGIYTTGVVFTYDEVNYNQPIIPALTWEIEKADIDTSGVAWNYSEPFTYDGSEKTVMLVGLPSGVTVKEYKNNCKAFAGAYTASAVLNYDSANYNAPTVPELEWQITKGNIDMSGVTWDYAEAFTYDGSAKTVELIGLPEGVSVLSYSGNTATDAGSYTATALLSYDADNFSEPMVAALDWTVNKAVYTANPSDFQWNYTNPFIYDGEQKYVELVSVPDGIEVLGYEINQATTAGAYIAKATLTHKNTNYEVIYVPKLRWLINKADYDMSSAKWNYTKAFTYDGLEKSVEVTGLPEGVTVKEYKNNTRTIPGKWTANVSFEYDEVNYNEPSLLKLTWQIKNATIEHNITISDKVVDYNGEVHYIDISGDIPDGVKATYYFDGAEVSEGELCSTNGDHLIKVVLEKEYYNTAELTAKLTINIVPLKNHNFLDEVTVKYTDEELASILTRSSDLVSYEEALEFYNNYKSNYTPSYIAINPWYFNQVHYENGEITETVEITDRYAESFLLVSDNWVVICSVHSISTETISGYYFSTQKYPILPIGITDLDMFEHGVTSEEAMNNYFDNYELFVPYDSNSGTFEYYQFVSPDGYIVSLKTWYDVYSKSTIIQP